jgi:hypothetical protein
VVVLIPARKAGSLVPGDGNPGAETGMNSTRMGAPLNSAVAVWRLVGPDHIDALEALCGSTGKRHVCFDSFMRTLRSEQEYSI